MGYDRIITSYYGELTNLVILLEKYVGAYRVLIGAADELNGIAMAKKSDVKAALKRSDRMGDLIEDLLDVIESCECTYLNYVKIKSEILILRTKRDIILTEIDDELLFKNTKKHHDDHKDNHHHDEDPEHHRDEKEKEEAEEEEEKQESEQAEDKP